MRLSGAHRRIVAASTGSALVLTTALGVGARPTVAAGPPADGAQTVLHTVALDPDVSARQAPAAGARTFGATPLTAVPARSTALFSLLGITWPDPQAKPAGTVQVRTRAVANRRWSPWHTLETDEPSGADRGTEGPGERGSTDPVWVGASDGVQVRVLAHGGSAPLPAGARLDLIDPGADPAGGTGAPAAVDTAGTAGATGFGARPGAGRAADPADVALPPRPAPPLVSRAGWRADESLNGHPPEYTDAVQALFVHHTAGTNSYSCSASARIIRSIHAYHVRSKRWNDIGYNFLVDKCGTLFEGRAGGIARPVLGAHTMGFNTRSAGIAVLGDYGGRGVSARVKAVIAQVAAYKIGMSGNGTGGSVLLTSAGSNKYPDGDVVRMRRISGHRNAVSTECPGNALDGQLDSIRALAAKPVEGLRISRVNGAVRVGDAFATTGPITLSWGLRTPTRMLSRFEIVIDGQLATARAATSRSAGLRLAPGVHTVRVRAVPLAGATSISAGWTVIADDTAPEFDRGPAVALRTGALHGTVPVTLSWRAADAVGVGSVTLTRPQRRTFGPSVTRWPTTARPAVPTTWTMRAADRAGNTDTAAVTRTPRVVAESAATTGGAWGLRRSSAFLGGRALLGATAGATLTWNFTGRSAALAVTRTPISGRVRVIVDGDEEAVLDLRSSAVAHRQAVFARSWSGSGAHTVRMEVVGTAGRPSVIADGLVYLP
ncbi:MAG TPA: N-acetylmuramoyl-L-alanine amidase [Actinoplanes sp.]|nr:N-acetylmuramoyl-L-alanine amidase [Actinoplanes sp.]